MQPYSNIWSRPELETHAVNWPDFKPEFNGGNSAQTSPKLSIFFNFDTFHQAFYCIYLDIQPPDGNNNFFKRVCGLHFDVIVSPELP